MTPPDPSLFQFRHGDHLCVFYRSEEALMEVLSPFIAEGLRKGERCFCVQRPEIFQRLEYDLRFIGVDVDSARKIGALEFHSACSHASLSISANHCITEIIADKFIVNPKYYYVVEQWGRGDVLGWGTAPDFNAASLQAENLVRQLSTRAYAN